MDLRSSLSFQSQNQSAFAKMISNALDVNMQSGFKIAIEHIEINTPYKKILTLVPLKKIDIVKLLPGDLKEKKVSGRYLPNEDKIVLRETPALRLIVSQLLLHEFGHHIQDVFLNPKNHDSHGHLINPKGTDIYVKYELVDDLYSEAQDEFEKEKARVEKESGVDIDADPDEHWQELMETGTNAPSIYALRTVDEWFGESFALYWTPSEEKEKFARLFPATYMAIDYTLRGLTLA